MPMLRCITAYHGSRSALTPNFVKEGLMRSSEQGVFGSGLYFGDLECANCHLLEGGSLLEVQITKRNLFHVKADYEIGERFDLETPALPLLMAVLEITAEQAAKLFSEITSDGFLLGDEVQQHLTQLGYQGVLATYERGVFEVAIYDHNIINDIRVINQADIKEAI